MDLIIDETISTSPIEYLKEGLEIKDSICKELNNTIAKVDMCAIVKIRIVGLQKGWLYNTTVVSEHPYPITQDELNFIKEYSQLKSDFINHKTRDRIILQKINQKIADPNSSELWKTLFDDKRMSYLSLKDLFEASDKVLVTLQYNKFAESISDYYKKNQKLNLAKLECNISYLSANNPEQENKIIVHITKK